MPAALGTPEPDATIGKARRADAVLFGAVGGALGMTPVFWVMGLCLVGSGYIAGRR